MAPARVKTRKRATRATPKATAARLVLVVGRDAKARRAAAAGVAKENETTLYRVDLQALVTRYLGETEKALDSVFARAEAQDAVIFFDESDALFGRNGEGARRLRNALRARTGSTLIGVRQASDDAAGAVDAVIRVKPKRKKPAD